MSYSTSEEYKIKEISSFGLTLAVSSPSTRTRFLRKMARAKQSRTSTTSLVKKHFYLVS